MAFGASTRVASFSGVSTMSGNSPSVSGSNTLAIVKTAVDNSVTVSGVTWNGVAMTEVTAAKVTDGTFTIQIWRLIAPAAGVTTVAVTASGNWSQGAFASCEYYTGIDQSTPISNTNTATFTTNLTSISPTISTLTSGEDVTDNVVEEAAGDTLTPASPSTKTQGGNNSGFSWGASYQANISSPSTVTMTWNQSGGTPLRWAWGAVTLKAASGAAVYPVAPVGVDFIPDAYASRAVPMGMTESDRKN